MDEQQKQNMNQAAEQFTDSTQQTARGAEQTGQQAAQKTRRGSRSSS